MENNLYRYVYGLTGIIGSGKSSVASFFKKEGAVILNADDFAKLAVTPKYKNFSLIKEKLISVFEKDVREKTGEDLFINGQKLNRKALREVVFHNNKKLKTLNEIIHPEVRKLFIENVLNVSKDKIIIYEVPLLFETKLNKLVRKTIVVYCEENTAIKRASERMGISQDAIKKILNKQISIEKKLKMADHIINNNGKLEETKFQVKKLMKSLKPKEI
ncbi:MAG: dephospho-CoA kinase [Spirochaetia bacterium]|nr:dephospho-CoA kinase [Spirochaetia bacterium]